jgi:hypothetical protein
VRGDGILTNPHMLSQSPPPPPLQARWESELEDCSPLVLVFEVRRGGALEWRLAVLAGAVPLQTPCDRSMSPASADEWRCWGVQVRLAASCLLCPAALLGWVKRPETPERNYSPLRKRLPGRSRSLSMFWIETTSPCHWLGCAIHRFLTHVSSRLLQSTLRCEPQHLKLVCAPQGSIS